MVTRPLLNVLCLLVAAAAPLACKPDRSKPRPSAADAAIADDRRPIAAGGSADGGATTTDAGAEESAPDAAPRQPGTEPTEPLPEQPQPKPKRGAELPTNIKALPKTWTVAQVSAYMKNQVARGLGVKCSHCHQGKDYASDASAHKVAARAMIQMTSAMNRQYFGGKSKLTCFTCHLGAEHPGRTR